MPPTNTSITDHFLYSMALDFSSFDSAGASLVHDAFNGRSVVTIFLQGKRFFSNCNHQELFCSFIKHEGFQRPSKKGHTGLKKQESDP